MRLEYPNLFRPLAVGKTVFRNRIFGGPHYGGVPFPVPTGRHAMHVETLSEEARGGAAKVTIGDTMVDPVYGIQPWEDMVVSRKPDCMFLGECAAAIKQYGAKAFVELSHPGQYALVEQPIGPMDAVFPSGVRVKGMDRELMKHVIECYAESAAAAKMVGFDGVMIHGGHGWLLSQFLSPLVNRRTDEYGGSPENRARFPRELVRKVREAVGPDFVVEYRISGSEYIPGGLTPELTGPFLQSIEDYIDLANISGGLEVNPNMKIMPPPTTTIFRPHLCHVPEAAEIKKRLKIPVSVVGSITSPEEAEKLIADGTVDAVTLVRALIADPYFPEKARAGRADDISPCVRCLNCLGESETKKVFGCTVNPTFPRTYRTLYEYAETPEKRSVLVIGGGFGGMKAAITAAGRGHDVTLCEASGALGGIIRFTDRDDLKRDLRAQKDYLIRQVEKRDIRVLLNTAVTKENADAFRADAIIVAAGSCAVKPPIPGIDLPHVRHILELYADTGGVGKNVVIIGGGLSGCETAVELGRKGHRVTVIEALKGFARDANRMNGMGLRGACDELRDVLSFHDEAAVTRITPEFVEYRDKDGQTHQAAADTVAYAVGMRARADLYLEVCNAAPYVAAVGDCVRPRRTLEAIREGYFAAMNIK